MGRTLVVHTGGIGDFLLCGPTLAPLSDSGPVDLLGDPARLGLAVAGGLADAVCAFESAHFDSIFQTPDDTLCDFLHDYARVVVWMRDEDGAIRRGLDGAGIQETQVHPGLPPKRRQRHATEYYLDCLGLPEQPPLRLAIEPAGDPHDVVIHPGSGGTAKNWPLHHFIELAAVLASAGRSVSWCLGPAEIEGGFAERLPGVDLIHADSLIGLAEILAGAQSYIGNDSGITHLAAAVGCPTLALFGPTDPAVWAPRGDRVRIVSFENGATASEVARYLDSAHSGN